MSDDSRRPDPSPISDDAADASQAYCPPTDGQPNPETMRDTSSTEKTAPTIRTDGGGRIDPDAFYCIDERRTAVVAGPFEDETPAREAAGARDSSHIIILGSSLMMLQDSGVGIRWEVGDGPDIICDGGETLRGSENNVPLTPPEVALMHLLRGCNLTYQEISDQLGCPQKTVGEYLRDSREAVRNGADPAAVFWSAVDVPDPEAADGLLADGGVGE
jgi:hypothetical protein